MRRCNQAPAESRRASDERRPHQLQRHRQPLDEAHGQRQRRQAAEVPGGAQRVREVERGVEVLLHPRRRHRQVGRQHQVVALEEAGHGPLALPAQAHGAHVVRRRGARQVVLRRAGPVGGVGQLAGPPAPDQLLEDAGRLGLEEDLGERLPGQVGQRRRLEQRPALAPAAPRPARTPPPPPPRAPPAAPRRSRAPPPAAPGSARPAPSAGPAAPGSRRDRARPPRPAPPGPARRRARSAPSARACRA